MNKEMVHAVAAMPNSHTVLLDELGNVHRAPCPHNLEARAVVTTAAAALVYGRTPCTCLRLLQ